MTVSFVVLSYNNARFIRRTLDSILGQTVGDFEVIVVDDASADESVEIIRSYTDNRIKLFRHETNRGLTPSYNEAIERAAGDFIVNLDSDDFIDATKIEKQLAAFAQNPLLGVVGTYITLIDQNDRTPANAPIIEDFINNEYDLNLIHTWIGDNHLVRSSTMMRRSLHERVGPNQLGMLRAPDYDLWTRALRAGFRFHVVPERLTFYRQHSGGLTYGDPKATFLELSYSFIRHLIPLINERADYGSLAQAVSWMVSNEEFAKLDQAQRYRLLALFVQCPELHGYQHFLEILNGASGADADLIVRGRHILAMFILHPLDDKERLLTEGVEFHRQQAENWKREYDYWHEQFENCKRERDDLHEQFENWKRHAERPFGSAGRSMLSGLRRRTWLLTKR